MPFVKLSIGEARIGVHHVDDLELPGFNGAKFRGTVVKLTMPSGYEIVSKSVCKPPDQFCRREGRIKAAKRLVVGLGLFLSKLDKALIFKTICPECQVGHKLDKKGEQRQ